MEKEYIKIALTLLLLTCYFIFRYLSRKFIFRITQKRGFSYRRYLKVCHAVLTCLLIALILGLSLVWDITFSGISRVVVTLITVIGVAFFGTWSLLSNISASLILFFNYPFKVGDKIKIIDGDNSIEGTIVDMNLFNIRIKSEGGSLVTCPNNLVLQKCVQTTYYEEHYKE